MAFKRIQLMVIWEILRRWHDGQPIKTISSAVGCDRKTVRSYIALARAEGLTQETVLERKEEVLPRLQRAVERLHSKATKQDLLRAHIGAIFDLINSPENPLKPKTAFEVVCSRPYAPPHRLERLPLQRPACPR